MDTSGIMMGLEMVAIDIGYANYQALYLDWFNNFLTVEGFASHHNISTSLAACLINNAKELYAD